MTTVVLAPEDLVILQSAVARSRAAALANLQTCKELNVQSNVGEFYAKTVADCDRVITILTE